MATKNLTDKQAIVVLNGLRSNPLFGEVHRQAFEIGIKAIEALEQEPCDDVISRPAAIKAAMQDVSDRRTHGFNLGATRAANRIKLLPSVNPQPKTGRWVEEVDDYGEVMGWHCDKCYEDSGFTTDCKWNFCPNCGTKMEVGE